MKETTSDTLAPFARQDGQNQPKWFNMTALANNNLSIKSDNLSIKQSKGIEMSIEAMKQALEALQYPLNTSHEGFNVDMAELLAHRAIKALEEALTKQEQDEPVGKFAKFTDGIWREVTDGSAGIPLYTTPQPKQEQGEPVAWMKEGWGPDCGPYIEFYRDDEMGWRDRKEWTPLYTTPQQRTWVGLTDEDMNQWIEEEHDVLRWAEAKLKEKNT